MPSPNESQPQFESKSSYPALEKPDFKPNVPGFLLEGASEQDRYIIEQLSLVNQYAQWSVTTELSTHEQVLKTNGRLIRAEKDIKEAKEDLVSLKFQAKAVAPFIKPVLQFGSLWEIRPFRWVFYGFTFFFFTYLLPWYLKAPFSIDTFVSRLFGSP